MQDVKLRLSQDEFYVLYNTCLTAWTAAQAVVLRPHLSIQAVRLAEWFRRARRQLYPWSEKKSTKEYAYSLPTSVAIALQHALLLSCPNHAGQVLLVKLNQSLVNLGYRTETSNEL